MSAITGRSTRVRLTVQPGLSVGTNADRLEPLVAAIVQHDLGPGTYVVDLQLVDEQRIRALNLHHRNLDRATDVLSFSLVQDDSSFVLPPGEPVLLGDVVVSYPTAIAQAAEYGHSVARELAYLVAHGTLHLLGHDHERAPDRQRMRRREEEALGSFGLTR